MVDQTELPPDEAPARPETMTEQVQQSESRKPPNEEQKVVFAQFFFSFILNIGTISWVITLVYLLVSIFGKPPNVSQTCASSTIAHFKQLITGHVKYRYEQNFSFDLHTFISEKKMNYDQEGDLIWKKQKLAYGDLDSAFSFETNVSISEVGLGAVFRMLFKTKL